MRSILLFLLVFSTGSINCQKKQSDLDVSNKPVFDTIPTKHPLIPMVSEISGIADSKINPGFIWGEQDSNQPPLIFLIGHDGKVKKHIYIKGAANRDWEDIAVSGGNIYIGDIGDNSLKRKSYAFYYFKEPTASTDTVFNVKSFRFKYPDGPHNAEAFLIDAKTQAVFIITKNDEPSELYKLQIPENNGNNVLVAKKVGKLDYTRVVSACQSPDGKEIIVKTYFGLQYYKRKEDETLPAALNGKHTSLPYQIEPQGEAICFAIDNSGFYTLSEKGFANLVSLYFYERN